VYKTTDFELDSAAMSIDSIGEFIFVDTISIGSWKWNRSNWMIKADIQGDTIEIRGNAQDTIFQVNEAELLRNFKGYCFLNYNGPNGLWKVKLLTLQKRGKLVIRELDAGKDDIEKLETVTIVDEIKNEEGETVDFTINPSKRQLKKILSSGAFGNEHVYQRTR